MTDRRRFDGTAIFATAALGLAAVALVVTLAFAVGWIGGSSTTAGNELGVVPGTTPDSDGAVGDAAADPAVIVAAAAEAMRAVTSVEFELERSGAPVYIDQFESIALNELHGQFTVPNKAQAELTVRINDNLNTKLGAVAIDSEVWISNPVTGDFETLPAGYDIDPSKFFDPENGWRPLLTELRDVELIGIENRGGDRYHVRGVAPAAQVREITVGLVRGQDVPIDLWVHPDTSLVTAAELTTVVDGADAHWALALDNYGDEFTIEPPENVTN
jgi:lipoprotein LprG